MKIDNTGGTPYVPDKARHLSDSVISWAPALAVWHAIKTKTAILLPFSFIVALAAGILLGAASGHLTRVVTSSADAFIEGYSYGAPFLIFLVLAPVLSRIFSTRRRSKFGLYVISWLAGTKVLALLWAVLFTVGDAMLQTSRSLVTTLIASQFFWAIYAAVITGLVAVRVKPLANLLEKGVTAIEYADQYMQPLIPFLMFAVGVYIQSIPERLEGELGLDGAITSFAKLDILGIQIDPNTTAGMVTAYVAGSLLVAVGCFIWHFAILALAKYKSNLFSVRGYFKNYWVKAYPLLWSTSSETLATPLNLYILSTCSLGPPDGKEDRRRRRKRPLHQRHPDLRHHPSGPGRKHPGTPFLPSSRLRKNSCSRCIRGSSGIK